MQRRNNAGIGLCSQAGELNPDRSDGSRTRYRKLICEAASAPGKFGRIGLSDSVLKHQRKLICLQFCRNLIVSRCLRFMICKVVLLAAVAVLQNKHLFSDIAGLQIVLLILMVLKQISYVMQCRIHQSP